MLEKKKLISIILDNIYPRSFTTERIDERHDLGVSCKKMSIKCLMVLACKSRRMANKDIEQALKMSEGSVLNRLAEIKKILKI